MIALALAAAVVPFPRTFIERAYSSGVYSRLQPVVTAISNQVPFALFDLLAVAVVLGWLRIVMKDVRGSRILRQRLLVAAVRSGAWAAALYLAFLVMWGFNYRRVRLADKLPFAIERVTSDRARIAAETSVTRLNALYVLAHAEGWGLAADIDPTLRASFDIAIGEAGVESRVTVGRPKRTLLDRYFRRAGVDGMTDPFFLETLVAGGLLPFERPVVIAHEWAHLAGIADEGEANFVGWLACIRGAPRHQYSAWLFLYSELASVVSARDRAEFARALAAGPRADLNAIRDRVTREVNPTVSTAGWRVYDSYLKANRVEAGAASYAEVVRLVLGVHLAEAPF